MRSIIRFARVLTLALALATAASGCMAGGGGTRLASLPFPAESQPVEHALGLEEATVIAETALAGLDEGDYELFTTAWSADMRRAIGEERFLETRELTRAEAGAFVRITDARVVPGAQEGTVRFYFACEFERAPMVYFFATRTDGAEIIGASIAHRAD